jgi:hypothetical protein
MTERFIGPLCLACLGREGGCIHRKNELWIPSQEEIEELRADLEDEEDVS